MVGEEHAWLPEFLDRVHQIIADTGFGRVSAEIVNGHVVMIESSSKSLQDVQKSLDSQRGSSLK